MFSHNETFPVVFGLIAIIFLASSAKGHYERPPSSDILKSCNKPECCLFSKGKYPIKKKINQNCYTGKGHDFRGKVNVSRDGKPCMNWREVGGRYWGTEKTRRRPYGIGNHNNCRNPDPEYGGGPWCYMGIGLFSRCNIPACKDLKDDTTYNTPPRTCDQNQAEFIFPDFMYSFRKNVYYVTKRRNGYVTYKFYDGNMTSFGDPPSENIKMAWNLCTSQKQHDIITFASSYDDKNLFVYLERPGAMVRINFTTEPHWTEVESSKYENCTFYAFSKYGESTMLHRETYTSIRQVYSVNDPSTVLLLANNKMIRCEWKNGILKYINSTISPFGTCPSGILHFIDRANVHYQLGIPPSNRTEHAPPNDVVRSSVLAVNENPVLAFPMLGYDDLNHKSLVNLHPVKYGSDAREVCKVDGTRSRIYQLYDGNHLDDIIRWLSRRSPNTEAWLRFHDINVRKSSFCDPVENVSCCNNIVKQFTSLETAKSPHITQNANEKCRNEMFFVFCRVTITGNSRNCPNVFCTYDDIENIVKEGDDVVCEIPLGNDPECSYSLNNILKSGKIQYKNAEEAVEAMDMIAATIKYQDKNDSNVLSTLVDSVQALEAMNYTSLSRSGAENLISDVMDVVDNIVDDERADVWISLQQEVESDVEDSKSSTENPQPRNTKSNQENAKKSPSDILFTLEAVLTEIVSSQTENEKNKKENSNFHMDFKTKNIHSVIRSLDVNNEELDADENFLHFDHDAAESTKRPLTIVSKYSSVMQLISQVENTKQGQQTNCHNEECVDDTENKIKFVNSSPVISASVMEGGQKISSSVTFVIPYEDVDIPDPRVEHSKFYFSCRYLATTGENGKSEWNSSGCEVTMVDHVKKLVHCSCNHTTNFAILLQVIPPKINKADMQKLQTISYIGETISVFCLVITMATFIVFRRTLKSPRMVAHFHLVFALIIFHTTQLLVVFAEKEKNTDALPCIIVTILTHFSLLATFCWMLCEGILLYMSVISVFHSMKYMNIIRYILGWVLPAFISGITITCGLTRHPYPTCYLQGVGDTGCSRNTDVSNITSIFESSDAQPDVQLIQWCWLSTSNYLIWAMAAPAMIAILINTVILLKVSWVIAQTAKSANMYRPTTEQKKEKHIRKCLKGAMLLMPILGVPWIFGLIPQAASHVGLLYVFTIFNSMQGFFILLFYCILSSEVRSAFNRCIRKRTLLHSQNWSSNMSGRHSYAEYKPGNRRSICSDSKSRTTSSTELLKRDSRRLLQSQLSSNSTAYADKISSDDVFTEKCLNNNARLPICSESSL